MNRIIVGRTALLKLTAIGLISFGFAALSLFGAKQRVLASAFGPSPVHTNAPGEGNCTACHADFSLNSGSGDVKIEGVPATYTPGQEMILSVTATQADAVIFGFALATTSMT